MTDNIKQVSDEYLYELKKLKQNDFDVHKDNIIKKLQNTIGGDKSAVFKKVDDVRNFLNSYIEYRSRIVYLVTHINKENIDKTQTGMVEALIEYKNTACYLNNIGGGQYFTSQSKFEPTILEEFMGFLLSPLIKNLQNVKCGPVRAYSEMSVDVSIDSNNSAITRLEQKTKNQDFSLFTEKKILEDKLTIQIPLVSIECKTYIDKTMLEGSITTAARIKSGNPQSKFYVVSETWDLSENEKVNPSEIDNVFVIRKCKRRASNEIDADVLKDIYRTINNDLLGLKTNMTPLENIKKTGKLKP